MPKNYRKRIYKKKKNYKKKGGVMTMFRNIRNKVYPFKMRATGIGITSNQTAITSGIINFKLTDCFNEPAMGGLFDLYKIVKVDLKFIPRATQLMVQQPTTNAAVQTFIPQISVAVDEDAFDTDTPPSGLSAVEQYARSWTKIATKSFTVSLRPKLRGVVLKTTAPTYAYTTEKAQWLDKADSTVRHCGVIFAMEPTGGTHNGLFEYVVEPTYYCLFKGVR